MAKKVGGTAPQTSGKDKGKEGKGKSVYNYKNAIQLDADGKQIPLVNSDGKLLGTPREVKDADGKVIQEAYNPRKHKPLKKEDFVDEPAYVRYTADIAEFQAQRYAEKAAELRKKAENLAKFGDPKTRKKVSKRERLLKQLAALEAEMAEEGVVLDELESDTE